MKICILTFGTRGDVQPYVALGLGLKVAGHTITIATSDGDSASSWRRRYNWGCAASGQANGCLPICRRSAVLRCRVAALGVGPTPIPQKQLTARKLAGAIGKAVADSDIRRRAAALGETIRGEDGIAHAVAVIEQHR